MKLSEVSRRFLEWEEEHKLFSLEVNDFPIYTLYRLQLYEALIFATDPGTIIDRDTSRIKTKVNIGRTIENSLSFFWNCFKLKKRVLLISNAENRRKRSVGSVDIYFDQIAHHLKGQCRILEFPKIGTYHYPDNYNKALVVKGDFLYVMEKLSKKRFDPNILDVHVTLLAEKFATLYDEINGKQFSKSGLKRQLTAKGTRNLHRLHIYGWILRFTRPKTLILKSAYTPKSQIILFWSLRLGIHTIEVQHGHIYPYHIGYIKPISIEKGLFPDNIFVWATYYREILERNRWKHNSIKITGDFTAFHSKSGTDVKISGELQTFVKQYTRIVTIIGQHSINEVFLTYLRTIENLDSNTGIIFKFHPRFGKSQEAFFNKHIGKRPYLHYMLEGDIRACFEVSDLVVGVYSTAVLEAIESKKEVHLIGCREAEFFEDFIKSEIVLISPDISSSIAMLDQMKKPLKTIQLRVPFNPESIEISDNNRK